MRKSYVSLEQKCCLICAKTFNTDAILLDRRMRDSMNHHTVTGFGICPEDQKKLNDGYVALVGVDAEKSTFTGETIKPEGAYRTGQIAYLRRERWANVFSVPEPEQFVFVQPEVIEILGKMQAESEGSEP